jgi:hypothetical protein
MVDGDHMKESNVPGGTWTHSSEGQVASSQGPLPFGHTVLLRKQ